MLEHVGGHQADEVSQIDQANRPPTTINHREFANLTPLESVYGFNHSAANYDLDRVA